MSESVFNTPAQPQMHYVTPPMQPSKYTREEVVPGVVLENYIKRQPDEDGQYVLVTTHSERLERIKQPEEIAAEKKAERTALAVIGSVVVGAVGLLIWGSYREEKIREGELAKQELTRRINVKREDD
jgi:hypothetical protein